MKKKTILLTGTTGFIGHNFLKNALLKNFNIIDILRSKNTRNAKIKKIKKNMQIITEQFIFLIIVKYKKN